MKNLRFNLFKKRKSELDIFFDRVKRLCEKYNHDYKYLSIDMVKSHHIHKDSDTCIITYRIYSDIDRNSISSTVSMDYALSKFEEYLLGKQNV